MTERLTLKILSSELETLRTRVMELEQQLERKLETTLDKAVTRLRSRIESNALPEHGTSIDTEQRQRLIAEQAYLIAEQRNFQGGDPAADWASAEKQVNDRLMQEGLIAKSAMINKKPATRKSRSKPASRAK